MKNKADFGIRSALWAAISLIIFIFDLAVKRYILNNCRPGDVFGSLFGIVDFVYVRNTGAAFSLLNNSTLLLSIISLVFCVAVVIYWIIKKPQYILLQCALALLFAGAVGNAVDRLAYKFVVDFISIRLFSFPVFNIADISIVLGAIAAIIYVIFFDVSEPKEKKNA